MIVNDLGILKPTSADWGILKPPQVDWGILKPPQALWTGLDQIRLDWMRSATALDKLIELIFEAGIKLVF